MDLSSDEIRVRKKEFIRIADEVNGYHFDIDNDNRQVIADIFDWCIMSPQSKYNPDKGLWIFGNIGVGKTTLLEVIRRFGKLVRPKDDNGWDYSFSTQAAGDIIRQYRKFGESGIEEIINSHRLAIDDLGEETEPVVRFGEPVNVLQEVLSRRYDRRFGSFTHVTTNCSREQIIAIYGERVFDRAKEMFNFVRLSGKTRRKN